MSLNYSVRSEPRQIFAREIFLSPTNHLVGGGLGSWRTVKGAAAVAWHILSVNDAFPPKGIVGSVKQGDLRSEPLDGQTLLLLGLQQGHVGTCRQHPHIHGQAHHTT